MKSTLLSLTFLALVLASTILSFGQSATGQFTSGAGNFSIAVDSKPTERKSSEFLLGKYAVAGESISWQSEQGTFTSVESYFVERERPNLTVAEKTSIIETYKQITHEQFKKLNIATSEVPFVFDGTKGVEIRGISAARVVLRIFFGKNRLYAVSVVRNDLTSFDSHLSLLNTFRLLSKSEYLAARIAENTPEPLPQTPRPEILFSDHANEKFIGNVRTVIEEYKETSASSKIPWSDQYFDTGGNLIREISYGEGFPDTISVWGWVDGFRVSRTAYIFYPVGEGANEKIIASMDEPPPGANSGLESNHDERYDNRYERTYDVDKRIATEKVLDNRGRVTTSKSFTYSPNRRDIVYRMGDGSFYNKTIQIFDTANRLTEERTCDERERDCDTTVFKYEFDLRGNWVVKRDFEKKVVRGKVSLKPNGIFYRKIEYETQ